MSELEEVEQIIKKFNPQLKNFDLMKKENGVFVLTLKDARKNLFVFPQKFKYLQMLGLENQVIIKFENFY